MTYIFDAGKFQRRNGKEVTDADFTGIAELGRLRPLDLASAAGSTRTETPSGLRTLKRAVFIESLSREASSRR